ncbi:MAG: hypothetical protein IJD79_04620, partial [Clostridia bacterium]|nr:hypothetical protein [Clostridia bacterium]
MSEEKKNQSALSDVSGNTQSAEQLDSASNANENAPDAKQLREEEKRRKAEQEREERERREEEERRREENEARNQAYLKKKQAEMEHAELYRQRLREEKARRQAIAAQRKSNKLKAEAKAEAERRAREEEELARQNAIREHQEDAERRNAEKDAYLERVSTKRMENEKAAEDYKAAVEEYKNAKEEAEREMAEKIKEAQEKIEQAKAASEAKAEEHVAYPDDSNSDNTLDAADDDTLTLTFDDFNGTDEDDVPEDDFNDDEIKIIDISDEDNSETEGNEVTAESDDVASGEDDSIIVIDLNNIPGLFDEEKNEEKKDEPKASEPAPVPPVPPTPPVPPVTPEAKPARKPAPKPAVKKSAPKPEPKPEVKPEPKPEVKPESKPEAAPAPTPTPAPAPAPAPKTKARPAPAPAVAVVKKKKKKKNKPATFMPPMDPIQAYLLGSSTYDLATKETDFGKEHEEKKKNAKMAFENFPIPPMKIGSTDGDYKYASSTETPSYDTGKSKKKRKKSAKSIVKGGDGDDESNLDPSLGAVSAVGAAGAITAALAIAGAATDKDSTAAQALGVASIAPAGDINSTKTDTNAPEADAIATKGDTHTTDADSAAALAAYEGKREADEAEAKAAEDAAIEAKAAEDAERDELESLARKSDNERDILKDAEVRDTEIDELASLAEKADNDDDTVKDKEDTDAESDALAFLAGKAYADADKEKDREATEALEKAGDEADDSLSTAEKADKESDEDTLKAAEGKDAESDALASLADKSDEDADKEKDREATEALEKAGDEADDSLSAAEKSDAEDDKKATDELDEDNKKNEEALSAAEKTETDEKTAELREYEKRSDSDRELDETAKELKERDEEALNDANSYSDHDKEEQDKAAVRALDDENSTKADYAKIVEDEKKKSSVNNEKAIKEAYEDILETEAEQKRKISVDNADIATAALALNKDEFRRYVAKAEAYEELLLADEALARDKQQKFSGDMSILLLKECMDIERELLISYTDIIRRAIISDNEKYHKIYSEKLEKMLREYNTDIGFWNHYTGEHVPKVPGTYLSLSKNGKKVPEIPGVEVPRQVAAKLPYATSRTLTAADKAKSSVAPATDGISEQTPLVSADRISTINLVKETRILNYEAETILNSKGVDNTEKFKDYFKRASVFEREVKETEQTLRKKQLQQTGTMEIVFLKGCIDLERQLLESYVQSYRCAVRSGDKKLASKYILNIETATRDYNADLSRWSSLTGTKPETVPASFAENVRSGKVIPLLIPVVSLPSHVEEAMKRRIARRRRRGEPPIQEVSENTEVYEAILARASLSALDEKHKPISTDTSEVPEEIKLKNGETVESFIARYEDALAAKNAQMAATATIAALTSGATVSARPSPYTPTGDDDEIGELYLFGKGHVREGIDNRARVVARAGDRPATSTPAPKKPDSSFLAAGMFPEPAELDVGLLRAIYSKEAIRAPKDEVLSEKHNKTIDKEAVDYDQHEFERAGRADIAKTVAELEEDKNLANLDKVDAKADKKYAFDRAFDRAFPSEEVATLSEAELRRFLNDSYVTERKLKKERSKVDEKIVYAKHDLPLSNFMLRKGRNTADLFSDQLEIERKLLELYLQCYFYSSVANNPRCSEIYRRKSKAAIKRYNKKLETWCALYDAEGEAVSLEVLNDIRLGGALPTIAAPGTPGPTAHTLPEGVELKDNTVSKKFPPEKPVEPEKPKSTKEKLKDFFFDVILDQVPEEPTKEDLEVAENLVYYGDYVKRKRSPELLNYDVLEYEAENSDSETKRKLEFEKRILEYEKKLASKQEEDVRTLVIDRTVIKHDGTQFKPSTKAVGNDELVSLIIYKPNDSAIDGKKLYSRKNKSKKRARKLEKTARAAYSALMDSSGAMALIHLGSCIEIERKLLETYIDDYRYALAAEDKKFIRRYSVKITETVNKYNANLELCSSLTGLHVEFIEKDFAKKIRLGTTIVIPSVHIPAFAIAEIADNENHELKLKTAPWEDVVEEAKKTDDIELYALAVNRKAEEINDIREHLKRVEEDAALNLYDSVMAKREEAQELLDASKPVKSEEAISENSIKLADKIDEKSAVNAELREINKAHAEAAMLADYDKAADKAAGLAEMAATTIPTQTQIDAGLSDLAKSVEDKKAEQAALAATVAETAEAARLADYDKAADKAAGLAEMAATTIPTQAQIDAGLSDLAKSVEDKKAEQAALAATVAETAEAARLADYDKAADKAAGLAEMAEAVAPTKAQIDAGLSDLAKSVEDKKAEQAALAATVAETAEAARLADYDKAADKAAGLAEMAATTIPTQAQIDAGLSDLAKSVEDKKAEQAA